MNKTPEAQSGELSTATNLQWEKPQRDTRKISPAVPIALVDRKILCTTQENTTILDQVTSRSNSYFRVLATQPDTTDNLSKQREELNLNFESSSTKVFVDHSFNSEQYLEEEKTEDAWSMDKGQLRERDKGVTQQLVLPSSAVSTEETFMYTSKVKLGPLCPKGSSISHLPSTIQPEALIEAAVRIPSTITLQSSCPQYSSIPGMPSLYQSQDIAWPDHRRILIQKLPSKRLTLLLYSDYVNSVEDSISGKIVNITPSCCRSSSIPGFPSALKCVSNMAYLLPTCARICKVPGLASVGLVTGYEKNAWKRSSLWEKPLQIKEAFVSHVSCVQEQTADNTNVNRAMVAILPTCARKVSVPGFPSAPLQKALDTPNMTSLFPTCPKQTVIAGLPFRERVRSYNDNWHVLRELILDGSLRSNPVLVQEKPHKDNRYIKHMVNMLPSCPWKAILPGFPSVQPKEHSVPDVSFAPRQDSRKTCRRKPNITDLPTNEPFGFQVEGLGMDRHILMEVNVHQNMPSIVSLVPMCPQQTQIPGMPCQYQNKFENKDWHGLRGVINKRLEKNTQAYILQRIPEDRKIFKDMVDLLISCPEKAKVFGFPSAPQLKPNMVNVILSCPRDSGVFGLPSKKLCLSSCKEWFTLKGLQLEIPFIKREVKILNKFPCFDKNIVESMSAILPSCPENAGVPGFPSALTQRLSDGSTVVNLLTSWTKESRVPGLPLRNSTKQSEWLIERKHLLLPREKPVVTLHLEDVKVSYLDSDMIVNTVSIMPTCSQTVCLPGFPSVTCQMLPKMINLLPACPRHSGVCGIPSRVHRESDEAKWNVDKRPVWERPLTHPGKLSLIYHHEMYSAEMSVLKIMLSMLPPCPKHSEIPGIPSKVGAKPVEAMIKEAPSMLKSLVTLPEHGKIPGLPAKYCAKKFDDWYADRDTVWQHPFITRYEVVYQDFTNEEMSCKDKEMMLSLLALCPRQALIPGFPSASHPQAVYTIVEKNPDMVELMQCCPRQSSIIGFPSVIYDSTVGGGTMMMIKTQDCSLFHKRCGCHKDVMKTILPLELSCPNIDLRSNFIPVSLSDTNQLSNMVNIVSSCPKNTSVLGVPSTHMDRSGQGWLVQKTLLVDSRTKRKEEQSLIHQQPALEEQSFYNVYVQERSVQFIFPGQDVPEDVQERMTIESSTRPTEAIVKDFPSSHYEIQVDKPSSTENETEILWDETSPIRLDFDAKKIESDVCSTLEMQKDGWGFWIPMEAEEVAVLEKG